MEKPNQEVETAKELSSFYVLAKNLLTNFSKKSFFSDFIILENNIKTTLTSLDATNNNSTRVFNKLFKLINKRKQELLELWAIDVIEGFQILQHSRGCDEVVIINTKFATNHHAHAVDVIDKAVAYPVAQKAFFATIAEQLKVKDKLLGMSAIQVKLVELTTTKFPAKPETRAAQIKKLFDDAVNARRRLLVQEQDKIRLFAQINAAVDEDALENFKKLRERIAGGAEFKLIQEDVRSLDGDQPSQAKMFFDHIKQQAVAANTAREEDFKGCTPNVAGVQKALLAAIDRQLNAKATIKPLAFPPTVSIVEESIPSSQPVLFGDPYHRLKKVAAKDSEKIQGNLKEMLPQIDLFVNITQDEFAALQKRIQKRINKYDQTNVQASTPTATASFPLELTLAPPQKAVLQEQELSDEERAARHIYTGAKTQQETPTKFSMDRESEKMSDVSLKPNSQGISLTFANAKPSQEALVAGAEVIKDAVELVTIKKKKVKELVISDFAGDLFSGLALYCSLACQNNPVRFDGEILSKQTPDNIGIYEVAELLKRLSQSEEGRKILIEMTKNDNEKLNEIVEVAKKSCMILISGIPTRNQDIEKSVNILAKKSGIIIPPHRDIIPPSPSRAG